VGATAMSFLEGLHGTIAAIVLCGLLFVDEAGLPLPIVPSEVLLLIAGLLIASGALPIWIFVPVACIAMLAGMIAGYSWARALGQTGLCALAERVGATAAYNRTRARLTSASFVSIGVARLIPGIRPYVTLIAGAAQVDRRKFLLGAAPALLVWEIVWIALGMLVGLPMAHYLGRFEKLALRGALLLVLGASAFLGFRRAALEPSCAARWCPHRGRALLAAIIDAGIIACIVVGLLAIGRHLLRVGVNGWIDLTVVAVVVAFYLFVRPDKPGLSSGALMR